MTRLMECIVSRLRKYSLHWISALGRSLVKKPLQLSFQDSQESTILLSRHSPGSYRRPAQNDQGLLGGIRLYSSLQVSSKWQQQQPLTNPQAIAMVKDLLGATTFLHRIRCPQPRRHRVLANSASSHSHSNTTTPLRQLLFRILAAFIRALPWDASTEVIHMEISLITRARTTDRQVTLNLPHCCKALFGMAASLDGLARFKHRQMGKVDLAGTWKSSCRFEATASSPYPSSQNGPAEQRNHFQQN
jgi:hypothetical protein